MTRKRWRDLPLPVRVGLSAAAVVEVCLAVAAQVDVTRLPVDRIRGGKLRWRLVSLINVVGPIYYFRRGRLPRRS